MLYNADMKAFIFDLYNTLIDVKTDEHCEKAWSPVVDFFRTRGIVTDSARLMSVFDGYWTRFNAKKRGEYQYPECDCVAQFVDIARSVGGKLSRTDAATALRIMRRASIERLRLFDGTLELLDELKRNGAGVYLLSNAQAAFTYDEIAECGLMGKFDGMLLSSEHGCRKPDPEFFRILFDKFAIDKNNAVMIGDDKFADGEGAAKVGIGYVWAGGGAAAHAREITELLK